MAIGGEQQGGSGGGGLAIGSGRSGSYEGDSGGLLVVKNTLPKVIYSVTLSVMTKDPNVTGRPLFGRILILEGDVESKGNKFDPATPGGALGAGYEDFEKGTKKFDIGFNSFGNYQFTFPKGILITEDTFTIVLCSVYDLSAPIVNGTYLTVISRLNVTYEVEEAEGKSLSRRYRAK